MRRAEAKAKCPELQCVHVETIGEPEQYSAPAAISTLLHCKTCAVAACCTYHASQIPFFVADTLIYLWPDVDVAVSKCRVLPSGTSLEDRDQ